MKSDAFLTSVAAVSGIIIFYLAWVGAVFALNPLNAVGLFMGFVGLIFWIWSLTTLGRFLSPGTEPKSPKLITTGPFSIVRHPIYFGATLLFLGATLISRNPVSILFLLAITWVEIEKGRMLLERFPEYREYSKRVGFMIPRI